MVIKTFIEHLLEDRDYVYGKDPIYVHFTSKQDAEKIKKSKKLWASSYVKGVFAVIAGGIFVPGIQASSRGRASKKDFAVMFTTFKKPKTVAKEEVIWDAESIKLKDVEVITRKEAQSLLDHTSGIPVKFEVQ